jgi:hypothetical protein
VLCISRIELDGFSLQEHVVSCPHAFRGPSFDEVCNAFWDVELFRGHGVERELPQVFVADDFEAFGHGTYDLFQHAFTSKTCDENARMSIRICYWQLAVTR